MEPAGTTFLAQRVQQAIRQDGSQDYAPVLDYLTGHHVLRAGLLLRCPRCQQTNFAPPDELADVMRCERCLERFAFPHAQPPRQWAYRPVGPFAVERYAAGAYSTLLALRALIGLGEFAATWAPSIAIDGLGELDFAIWRRRRLMMAHRDSPELVLGEAKSFDQFADRDVERLLRIRQRFGQGWLCFATLRDELAPDERGRLRQARQDLPSGGLAAPLIVLTASELWSRNLGADLRDRLAEAKNESGAVATDGSAERLAWATQTLYL
jgi:hypothetical protein